MMMMVVMVVEGVRMMVMAVVMSTLGGWGVRVAGGDSSSLMAA